MVIAALYVQTNGCYFGLPDVDPWDEARDARKYPGPWPVVAHPPCQRWGSYYWGGPTITRLGRERLRMGDDDGCFAAALSAVRRFGGILEHPAKSHAWRHFGLNTPPSTGAWIVADFEGGWTCHIEQGVYGHKARKATWLYAHGIDPPSLKWGRAEGKFDLIDVSAKTTEERRRLVKTEICQQLSKCKRAATPHQFSDLLISIAKTARKP